VKHFDVAIIGRGIAGLSLARELLQNTTKSIALIGPEKALDGSGTIVAQGISTIRGLVLAKDDLFAAKLAGHRHLSSWLKSVSQESGLDIPFHGGGVGEVATTLESFREGMDRAYHRRFQGVFGPVAGHFSGSAHRAYGALHQGDFWFDPEDAMKALEAALRKAGPRFTAISKIVLSVCLPGSDRVQITTDDGESLAASQVVFAAGANTPTLLEGPFELRRAGWRRVEGETFITPKMAAAPLPLFLPDTGGHHSAQPVSSFVRGAFSLSRRKNGSLIVGSTTYKKGSNSKKNPVESMLYEASMVMGKSASEHLVWTPQWGVRLRASDRAPVCGVISGSSNRLWVFSGFYKNGLQLAPFLAQPLAQAIAMDDESPIFSYLRPSRFGH
jgi:glycine/D-amino acid oxidase-like deaminating enzyme